METIVISNKKISYKNFISFLKGPVKVSISKSSKKRIDKAYTHLCSALDAGTTIYGVNTGFGKLSNISINKGDQERLQINLVKSHASGIGKPLDLGIVRIILFLKILTYSKGYSGVSLSLVNRLILYLNKDILPFIPQKGSVGASGDLAPLGHMALTLIGEGKVFYKGKLVQTNTVLKKLRLKPIKLMPKEGLSLINGTQVCTAIAIKACLDGENILKIADIAGALSVENSLASRKVFKKNIHLLKEHPGQKHSAKNVFAILSQSQIVSSHSNCGKVQDPYSFRCIPHIHGACRDTFYGAVKLIDREINSVSDNPVIMDDGSIMNSGHFHGEHIAHALDMMGISFSEIGAISERRCHFFMKGINQGIPPFLAKKPGLESGYMIAHVTATALVSENKTLSHPASVDSLPTSGGQEDIVSMAPWAGYKLFHIQENVCNIMAIEMLVAGAANNIISKNLNPGKGTAPVLKILNQHCKYDLGDRPLSSEIRNIVKLIISGDLLSNVSKSINLE